MDRFGQFRCQESVQAGVDEFLDAAAANGGCVQRGVLLLESGSNLIAALGPGLRWSGPIGTGLVKVAT